MENGNIEEPKDIFTLGAQDPDHVAMHAMRDVKTDATDRELRARAHLAGEAIARRMTAASRWRAAQEIAENTPKTIDGEDAESAELRQQAAFKAMEKYLAEVDREGVPTGRFDRLGTMWKQGGFETGAEAFAFMSDLLKNGPEAGLTQEYKDFYAKDWAGQVALAREKRGLLKKAASAVGSGLDAVASGFQTSVLTGDELRGAPAEIVEANKLLIERDTHMRLDRVGSDPLGMVAASSIPKNPYLPDEKTKEAERKIEEYRQHIDDEAVRAEYAMELNKKNAWSALTTLFPTLGEEAQTCVKAIIDSPSGALPLKHSATFKNLSEQDQNTVILVRNLLKPHVESTFGNTIEDALTGAANITLGIALAPYRIGNKYGNMLANGLYDTGVDVNELARTRQRLYQATGSFFAGGDLETGMLPQMQFEQVCDNHGVISEAVIGAISTLPYMAAASLKGAQFATLGKMGRVGAAVAKAGTVATSGTSLVALEAMQEFDEHTAMNGGDITNPGYIARSFVMGGLYAYIEKLQVNGLLGGISEQRVREGLLKGFWSGMKNGTVPRMLFTETLSESVQEGLQAGVMAIHESLALEKNVSKEFGSAFIEDFVGSLGTMAIIGAGGLVVGHARRSGMHLRGDGTNSASELRRMERSRDLSSLYMSQFAHNNMVQAGARATEYQNEAIVKEVASLGNIWSDGGRAGLIEKGGVSETAAARLDEMFKAMRAAEGSAVQQAAGEAIREWNKSRGIEATPTGDAAGSIGQHYFENLINQYIRGAMKEEDFSARLVGMGFSQQGARDYIASASLERKVHEKLQSLQGFLQGRYERKYGSEKAVGADTDKVRAALGDLARARNIWAQGAGIYHRDGGELQDPGAKALEEFGFTKPDAERLSRLFHYERAAAYSKVALDGIRAMYERATRGRVSAKAALAGEFKGRIERLATGTDEKGKTVFGDFIRFELPKGRGAAYVRVIETPTGAPDFTKADKNVADSVKRALNKIGKKFEVDDWLKASPEEREKIWNDNNLVDEGFFTPDKKVDLQLADDPSARIDSNQAKRLVFGSITLAANSALEGLANIEDVADGIRIPSLIDSSVGFHEVYHAWIYFMKATGALTEADEKQLAAQYGKNSRGQHDEEAAADALRSHMNRRITGRMTAEDERSPFAKIYSLARKLIRRGEEKAVRERIAANAEEAFLDQIIVDNYTGLGELGKEPKKPEGEKPAAADAPQMPGRKDGERGAESAKPGPEDGKRETSAGAPEAKAPKAAPKPAAVRGWSAFTPTGNIRVGGHWAVVDLADLIHSNHPAYAIHMRKQLRNRKDNKAEEDTRKNIVNNFQGERLLEAPDTANGAPIVFLAPDDKGVQRLFVLSGNGRVLVLNELAERHLYDKYRNVMKAWAEENGLEVPEGETPVLVRVIDDLGGSTLDTIADLSNTNAIQQYTEEEQARADAEVIKALDIARLYHANANGTADMTPGVNDEFFSEFIRGVGDTSLYNSDLSLTETARVRAVRALLAIAVGQGDRGRDVVKKLIEQTDTLNIARQKNAAAIMAAAVAALESNDAYSIGPDVSRAMADFIDFAEKKKAGKVGTFGDYFSQMDLIDGPSELAREILQLFGSKQSAVDIAEYVITYCQAAAQSDPTGGLFGPESARSRLDIWKDAKKLVDERRAADGGTAKHSIKAEAETLYHGSAADWIHPSLQHAGEGQGAAYQGYGLNMTTHRAGAEFWARVAKRNAGRRTKGLVAGIKAAFAPEYVYSAELPAEAKTIGYYESVPEGLVDALQDVLRAESIHLSTEERERLTGLAGHSFEHLAKFVASRKKGGRRISVEKAAEIIARSGIDASWMPSVTGVEGDRDYVIYNLERLKNFHQWANGRQKHSIKSNDYVEITDKEISDALEKYGRAENPTQAVYALPDGTLMRGKGVKWNLGGRTFKTFGHDSFTDDILERIPGGDKMPTDREKASKWMLERMDAAKRSIARTGAIRLASDGTMMEIFKEPTAEQYSTFYDIVYYASDNLTDDVSDIQIDVSDTELNVQFSISYRLGTSPRRIIEDLRGWFKSGVLPLGASGSAAEAAGVEPEVHHSIRGVDFTAMAKYYQGDVRNVARALKRSDPYALKLAAETMARAVPDGAVLVPVPGHDGQAHDTLALATEISAITGSPVVEALRGSIREPIYAMKQEGYLPGASELGFYRAAKLPEGREIILIDNVVGTGTTAVAASEALGSGKVLAFAWDHTAPTPVGIAGEIFDSTASDRRHSVRADEKPTTKQLDLFADAKGITDKKRRKAFKKTVDGFAKFADDYRALYARAIREGDWKSVLDFVDEHGLDCASNILKRYFTEPKFETAELAGMKVTDSADVAAILMTVRSPFVESIKAIYLDKDKRILDARILTIGQPSQTFMARGAVSREMPEKTKFVVVSHNHPSGNPEPSKPDVDLTKALMAELSPTGAKLLDHIITDGQRYYSFNERSLFEIDVETPKWEIVPSGSDDSVTFSTQQEVTDYVAAHLRDDGDKGHLILMNGRLQIVGVKRIPSVADVFGSERTVKLSSGNVIMGDTSGLDAALEAWIEASVRNVGATGAQRVIVDLGTVGVPEKAGQDIAKRLTHRFGLLNIEVDDILSGSEDFTSWRSARAKIDLQPLAATAFPKYSFAIGERGASNLSDALFVAANLSEARRKLGGRDWQKIPHAERVAIKFTTGWEKGADGKWRMERPSLPELDPKKFKRVTADDSEPGVKFEPITIGELFPKADIFSAYPWLKRTVVELGALDPEGSVRGQLEEKDGEFRIKLQLGPADQLKRVITHELQHQIQRIEDFARGGNVETAKRLFLKRYREASKEAGPLDDERIRLARHFLTNRTDYFHYVNWPKKSEEYRHSLALLREHPEWNDLETRMQEFKRKWGHQVEFFLEGSLQAWIKAAKRAFKDYQRLAGEVEARNVAGREYSADVLLEDTEDVERRYQVLVDGALEEFKRIKEDAEEDAKHSFAGLRGNYVAGVTPLDDAEVLESRGEDRETVYRLTGWYRGADGFWRVELPFHGRFVFEGDFDGGMTKGYRTVGDYFEWPELFQAYPELADVEVKFEDMVEDVRGDFDPRTKTIRINNSVRKGGSGYFARMRVAPVMIHEIQHAIQSIEDHARGGDPDDFLTWDRAKVHDVIRKLELARELSGSDAEKEELSEMIEEHRNNLKRDAQSAEEWYYRLAGEVEARNAADRFFSTPSWRLAHPPWETEDVKREEQHLDFTEEEDVHWDNIDTSARHSVAARLDAVRRQTEEDGGQLLLAYHGTRSGGFTVFDRSANDYAQQGFYFAKDRDTAMTYSSEPYDIYEDDARDVENAFIADNALYNRYGIYNVALRMMKPLVVECAGGFYHSIPDPFRSDGAKTSTREIVRIALESGYDGVIFRNVVDYGPGSIPTKATDVYVVKEPRQIKVVDAVTYDDKGNIIPDYDRFDWSVDDVRHSFASAWGGSFPDVAFITTRKYVNASKDLAALHEEAKAGSLASALRFVDTLMPDEPKTSNERARVDKLRQIAADYPKAVLVPVIAHEKTGHNMLPFAYAKRISEITGLKIMTNIRQTVKANHTGAGGLERIMRSAEFEGSVVRGRAYIMVDDHVTQGGTFGALRRHILDRGGKVVAATTLTISRGSSILSPREVTLEKLTAKFGKTFAEDLRKAGVVDEPSDLTESQARYILKYTVEHFRDLAARAFHDRSAEAANRVGPGYAGRLRSALRSEGTQPPGASSALSGRASQPGGRLGSHGSASSDVNNLIPGFRKYWNPETKTFGETRFARAEIIKGPVSRELDAAISEALDAGEMSGDEKLKLLDALVARIKATKEGKIVFGRYREGASWDGTEVDWNRPERRELHERIYRELAIDPVTANNNEALEINKNTGKPKNSETIARTNEANPDLPRISDDADAQYTPLRERRLDIVVGPPAAGKSSVFVDLLSVYHRSRVFDSDAIKKRLPGFDKGNGASFVHEESSQLNKEILRRFLDRRTGENVVLPIVGAKTSGVKKYIDLFRQEGYSIYLHNNFVPITHAFGRAWERTLSTGRLIPPEVFLGCMDAPSAVFEELRNQVDYWDEFNNDGPLGSKPVYVRGSYVDEAYGGVTKQSAKPVEISRGLFANPQLMFDFAQALDLEEAGGDYRRLFPPAMRQGMFDFGTTPEERSKHAIRADIRENRNKAAEEALTNWITYFRLSHGSIPRDRTIARMGLAMGMNVISTKKILDKSEKRAEQMRGTLIEKAAANGDVATTMALLKREDGVDEAVERLLSGGVSKGGELTHKGVGQINTIIGKRVEEMMRDFSAATLADMEGETGLDLAAEILEQNPDAFADEIKGSKGIDPDKKDDPNAEEGSDTDGPDGGGGGDDAGFRQETDLDRYNRERAREEALKKVEDFIARAKEKAAENRAKAEERRRRMENRDFPDAPGGAGDGAGNGGPTDLEQEYLKQQNANPVNVKANFKTKEEFAAFMRVWAEHKFDRTHGLSSLGKSQRDRLFAEFYRITVRQELQDLADKLLAPKDERGVPIQRIAKLGNGARNVVSRRIAELEKGLRPDTIERISGNIFAFINAAAIRVSRTDLVSEFKKEIKAKYIKGAFYEDLKLDSDRRVTGWVEEAARYICRVCDLSKRGINGDISQLAAERKELVEIINRRADVYDESGKEVAQAAVEDMETKKAMWKLALLDKYGAMTSLMPGEILDLRTAAFEYLENQAAELEKLWRDTREYEEGIRRDLCGAITGPNGQRYREHGWLDGRLFDALNGLIRLRLQHLTRFADEKAQAAAKESINKILVLLADGEVAYNRMLQDDRQALFEGLGAIFQRNGRADNGAIKKYLNRMTEPIPAELAAQISNQGFADSMTYGQMLQLLVSLEQRSFKDSIEYNGRQEQAELIRNFTVVDEKGNRTRVFTQEDNRFIEWLRAFYAAKRDVISPITMRMVGQQVDSPDPLYCPIKRSMEDRVQPLAGSPSTWDPIAAVFTRRVQNNRDFDEQASILGMFFDRSNETAKLIAWAERGTIIRGVFTNVGVQSAIRRAFGPGELRKIMTQLLATFNGGESRTQTPGELAAVDKALNFTTYAYLGFNPLSSAKQTTSFTVWANALPGGFKDLWKHMWHYDKKVIKHLKESDVYKVRYGNEIGSGQDLATKGLNMNPSMNPVMRMLSGAGMWMLKKGDFLPGAWIASGVYKDILDKHLQEGMEFEEADKLAITETFNMLEETQQSGRTYNTNMLTIEHGRIGRLLTQFATSPLQQLQYETQAWREWRDMVRYNQGERKIAAARQKLVRATVINHLLLPAALHFVTAVFKKLMGEEPPWEKDGYHWSLLIDVLLGQFSRVFFIGVFSQTALKALFSRQYPRAGQILPVEGALGMAASLCITAHDIAVMDAEKIRKDLERLAKATAPTRIPYNIYRRIVGDADVDRKAKKEAKKRK